MRDSADPSRSAPMRRLAILGLVFVAAILSCGKDVTGPLGATARYVRGFAWNPIFPPAFQAVGGTSSGVVQFTRVHVVLDHDDGTIALDTTIDFPAGDDSVTLDLTVKLLDNAPASGEPMTLSVAYLDAAGDTVFKGGPVSITAAPAPASGGANPPVQVPVTYTGPGATAVAVAISPRSVSIIAGAGFTFSAIAKDNTGAALSGTPIIWNSLDPSIATITSAAAGAGVAQNQRGTARIVAQLLTGAADTVQVFVSLPASQIIAQSGNAQTAVVGTTLAQPLVVKVAASDGVGVAGTTVNFAVASGGGSVTNASVVSDANGLAQTTWKLGTGTGAQSVTASAGSLANSPLTFTASAQAATATKLVVTTSPSSVAAGTALSPVVVTAEDNNGNVATAFTGPVTVTLFSGTTGATLGGTTTVNAVAGVATFAGLTINKNGTAYTLVASSTGLTSATTSTFDIAVGAPSKLVFTAQPAGAIANAAMPAIVVNVQDSQGNPTPAFTGAVVLALATTPTAATLGGTLSVTAVAGVATFTGITVSLAGTGYTLTASSTGLTAATSALFNIGGAVAASISVASGGGQTGAPSAALAQPIVIQVSDAGANPVAGTTVNFAVVTGTGSVLPATGVSNAAGQVQTVWTLGPGLGAQSISATSGTLTGSPLTINATAAATAATQLVITAQPTNAIAGVSIAPSITVTAKDAGNNLVATFTNNVTLAFGANPGGSTLSGTVTVAAVAGVATFNNISLNKAANAYTLVASSGALTQPTSSPFNISAAAASSLGISAGQGQSGSTAAPLVTPLAVSVMDAFGNAVSGVTVNWGTPSGGSFSPVSSATNAAGVATSTWTLGPTGGAQTATATSGALVGSPATFNATATLAAFSRTWTGATSTAWTTAANWAPAGVPAAGDSVDVPSGGNQPTISAAVTVKHLTLGAGAVLTFASSPTLTVTGNLTSSGAMVGAGVLSLTGTGNISGGGAIGPTVQITGTYALTGSVTVNAATTISGSGSLTLAGHALIVNGAFATAGSGTVTMTNSADVLTVNGAATFAGGSESGLLSAGNLVVTGNFTQSTTATSFIATASHVTTFSGVTAQTISLANPGTSGFGAATFANTAGITVSSNLQTNGNTTVASGTSVNGGTNSAHIGGTLTDLGAGLQFASLQFAGTTTPVAATTPTLNVTGSVDFTVPSTLAGNLVINGALAMSSSLTVNGHALTINGNFSTNVSSVLVMTNTADSVVVNGNATFGGGSESGLLTAGKLYVTGNFAQVYGGSGAEFQAIAPHVTVLSGNAAQTIAFANPDTVQGAGCSLSCFGSLTIHKTGGTVVYNTPAHHHGKYRVMTGVTSVSSTHFVTVHDSTITPPATPVMFARFDTKGNLAIDTISTIIDTIVFHGTAAQVIPPGTYNETVIKGTPTLTASAGGFTTTANLTVDGGTLTLNSNAVSVLGGFRTTNGGTLVMANALDSLLIVGQATFAGGAETGSLTNGALVLFQGIVVSGPNQFTASGNHVTYLVGPFLGCDCTDVLVPGRRGTIAMAGSAGPHHGPLTKAALTARRVAAAARSPSVRAQVAASLAAREALAAKWTSRLSAMRAAAAAGNAAGGRRAAQGASASVGIIKRPTNLHLGAPGAPGNGVRSASIVVQPYSDTAVYVAFADTTANQFANVRVVGNAQWQTFARAAGQVRLDPTGTVLGNGHLAIGDTLFGASSSTLALEAVELFGVLADTGTFTPDTTVFSGVSQTMPSQVGSSEPYYNKVVVNSPSLSVPAEDGTEIDIHASLFIQNSGQLRIGAPISACGGCESDELYVWGALQTLGAGALQMTDANQPYVVVYGNASFAGGSTSGLMTQGEIDYYQNFSQSGPTTTSYAATSPNQSYFGAITGVPVVTFANPAYASSHFGDLYFGDSATTLQSNVFADGQLQFGSVVSHIVQGTPGLNITSKGASARNILFSGVSWTLLDGYSVDDMDAVEFSNQVPTGTQFSVQRSAMALGASLTNWIFDTTPTGGGLYISATDTDGSTNGFLTINMSGTSPAVSGGFTSVINGAIITGWPATVVDNWLGVSSVWNSTGNWSTGLVPTASTDVAIFCDCSAPQTNVAAPVHNLTISNGNTLTLGTSSPLTVNGDLSIGSTSNINASAATVTMLGNVSAGVTGNTGITCSATSPASTISGTGTHTISGRFCKLNIASNLTANGPVSVGGTSAGVGNLTIATNGKLDLGGNRVDTDSMFTSGTGTITMQHAADSLVIHGAPFATTPVNFNGGSETGLITNGTVVLRSNFRANGTSFDASGSNIVVADTTAETAFTWIGATVGHGFNNLILKNSTFDNFFSQSLVVTGTLTLDASMGTSGQFDATAANLYVGQAVDNTGNINGAFSGAYWLHITGNGAIPAVVGVDSLIFDSGANNQLSTNLTAHAIVVRNDGAGVTGLYLNGHIVKTNNFDFTEGAGGFLGMTNPADSLNVGTGNVFFNGSYLANTLTAGGIAAGGFYQGYTNTTTPASGNDVNSYSPSGTHRLWLTHNAPIIFANPGTGSSLSHFNTLHNPSGYTGTLYSNVFVDDSIYFATSGTAIFNSNVISSAANTRTITTKGLADNTTSTGIEFNNVALSWVDGQTAPTHFDNVQWTGFPLLYTGTAFTVNRSTSAAPTFDSHDFTALVLSGLSGGHFVNNISPSTGPTLNFTNVLGIPLVPSFSVAFGTSYQYP